LNSSNVRVPETTADDRFVPFGIEATGHLGTEAKKLLQRILNPNNLESDSKLRRILARQTNHHFADEMEHYEDRFWERTD
jgi:hypothetical protein